MAVITNQMLEYENLISYKCCPEDREIPYYVHFIETNVDALEVKICGPVIIGRHEKDTEFLIPVSGSVLNSDSFSCKSLFRLTSALMFRHYGSYVNIGKSIDLLKKYISDNCLVPITHPYIVVKSLEREVFDIYIGLSENVL